MAEFVVEFGKAGKPPAPDGRLDAPAFHRNHEAIWSAIAAFLERADRRRAGARQRHRAARHDLRRAARRSSPGGRAIFTRRISPASRPGGGTRGLPTCARRNASTSPIPHWTWTADGQAGPRAHRHALHQRAAHFALGGVAKPDRRRRPFFARRRPAVRLRPVHARRRAHRAEQCRLRRTACGRKIRNGACATSPISTRSRRTPA